MKPSKRVHLITNRVTMKVLDGVLREVNVEHSTEYCQYVERRVGGVLVFLLLKVAFL